MNDNQRISFYFPAWNKAAAARGWRMAKGRLVADLAAQREQLFDEPMRTELLRVLDYAEVHAGHEHRAVTATDLRHACNWIASKGRTVKSEAMDNRATTMAVRLFKLLADPLDLSAISDWLNPAEADRKDFIEYLRRTVDEAKLRAIAFNTWETREWQNQGLEQLQWLHRTAKGVQQQRRNSFATAIARDRDPNVEPW